VVLDAATEKLRQQVIEVVRQNVKDADAIAADIGTRVEDQLWRWGKVLTLAAALLAIALAVFGFTSVESAKARIDQAATAGAGALNKAAQEKKEELDRQGIDLSGALKTEAQQAEGIILSYAPRERAVNVDLQRLERAVKEQNARVVRLQQIRDVSPDTPIGSINSQLFQTQGISGNAYEPSISGTTGLGLTVPNYSLGSAGEGVKSIQSRLLALGCYSGPISGEFDSSTEEGVKAFKEAYSRSFSGVVNISSIASAPISGMPDPKLTPTFGQLEANPGDVGPLTWSNLFSPFSARCN
jgi:hypothetical protein